MSIAYRLSEVRRSLPEGVTLVAVSKTHPAERIREAYDAGQRVFGENRPQELRAKAECLPADIEWHMIGHVQTNKARYVAAHAAWVESVDSARVAEALQREAARCGRVLNILLEVHVADEESKTGWALDELLGYVRTAPFAAMPNLRVRGVMGVATNTDDMKRVRDDFRALHSAFDVLKPYFDAGFDTLSMGMSHDYPLAVECGATTVRVGSLIFRERGRAKSGCAGRRRAASISGKIRSMKKTLGGTISVVPPRVFCGNPAPYRAGTGPHACGVRQPRHGWLRGRLIAMVPSRVRRPGPGRGSRRPASRRSGRRSATGAPRAATARP